jgi:hypothetical protein
MKVPILTGHLCLLSTMYSSESRFELSLQLFKDIINEKGDL